MSIFDFIKKRIQDLKELDKEWHTSGLKDPETTSGTNDNIPYQANSKSGLAGSSLTTGGIHLAQRLKALATEMAQLDEELSSISKLVNLTDQNQNQHEK